jgi:hypothetical protein
MKGRCTGCGAPLDREPRPQARSLFGCPVCGRTVAGDAPLPPAVPKGVGVVWSTDRDHSVGAVFRVNREAGTVTLTVWESPFLQGRTATLSLAEFQKRFGFK